MFLKRFSIDDKENQNVKLFSIRTDAVIMLATLLIPCTDDCMESILDAFGKNF